MDAVNEADWIAVAHFRFFDSAYEYLQKPKEDFVWVDNDTGVMYVHKDGHLRVRAYVTDQGHSSRAVEINYGPTFKERVEEMLACFRYAQENLSESDYKKFLEYVEHVFKPENGRAK